MQKMFATKGDKTDKNSS